MSAGQSPRWLRGQPRPARERASERESELLETFNRAAMDVTSADLKERESLLGGFANGLVDR